MRVPVFSLALVVLSTACGPAPAADGETGDAESNCEAPHPEFTWVAGGYWCHGGEVTVMTENAGRLHLMLRSQYGEPDEGHGVFDCVNYATFEPHQLIESIPALYKNDRAWRPTSLHVSGDDWVATRTWQYGAFRVDGPATGDDLHEHEVGNSYDYDLTTSELAGDVALVAAIERETHGSDSGQDHIWAVGPAGDILWSRSSSREHRDHFPGVGRSSTGEYFSVADWAWMDPADGALGAALPPLAPLSGYRDLQILEVLPGPGAPVLWARSEQDCNDCEATLNPFPEGLHARHATLRAYGR